MHKTNCLSSDSFLSKRTFIHNVYWHQTLTGKGVSCVSFAQTGFFFLKSAICFNLGRKNKILTTTKLL